MRPSTHTPPLTLILVLGSCLALLAAGAMAQAPRTLSYQGRLVQNTADQGAVDGTVDIVFSLWTGPASDGAATQLWTESWSGVALSNGIFSVLLGSNGSPLDPADFQGDSSLFLQLQVDGETLLPRQQLGSAPFAFVDEPANELQDLSLSGDQLSLSDSSVSVDLSPYLDDTDAQTLGLVADTLSISGSGSSVDLSAYRDNTDAQTLGLAGNTLTISGSGSSVDLASLPVVAALIARTTWLEERLMFVTPDRYRGDLGGLEGADAICQSLADAAGFYGSFRAWLSDSTTSAAERLAPERDRPIRLVDGTTIATDWLDLLDGEIAAPIHLTELGDVVERAVWTGTYSDGSVHAYTCDDWQTALFEALGSIGKSDRTNSTWTNWSSLHCNGYGNFYCLSD